MNGNLTGSKDIDQIQTLDQSLLFRFKTSKMNGNLTGSKVDQIQT